MRRRVTISDARIPVSSAIRTIQCSIGLMPIYCCNEALLFLQGQPAVAARSWGRPSNIKYWVGWKPYPPFFDGYREQVAKRDTLGGPRRDLNPQPMDYEVWFMCVSL
jgi:hypothetical protein